MPFLVVLWFLVIESTTSSTLAYVIAFSCGVYEQSTLNLLVFKPLHTSPRTSDLPALV